MLSVFFYRTYILNKIGIQETDLQDVSGLSIIVTCRVNYITPGQLGRAKFPYAILQPWNGLQIKNFADLYGTKTNTQVKSETLEAMCRKKKANLYGIPLIAYMIFAAGTELTDTSSETDIFDRLFSSNGGILDHQI